MKEESRRRQIEGWRQKDEQGWEKKGSEVDGLGSDSVEEKR